MFRYSEIDYSCEVTKEECTYVGICPVLNVDNLCASERHVARKKHRCAFSSLRLLGYTRERLDPPSAHGFTILNGKRRRIAGE